MLVKVHSLNWFVKNCNIISKIIPDEGIVDCYENPKNSTTLMIPKKLNFCGKEVEWDVKNFQIKEDDGKYFWEPWMFDLTEKQRNSI